MFEELWALLEDPMVIFEELKKTLTQITYSILDSFNYDVEI